MYKKIIKTFSVYTITAIVSAGLSIFILPILTKYLSPKDYGITALFSTYVMIASPFMGFSSSGLFWIKFFKQEDKDKLNKYFSTYYWFVSFCAICLIFLLLIFSPIFKSYSFFNILFIALVPITSFFSVIGDETRNYFVNNKRPVTYFVYSISVVLFELALSYIFVVYVFRSWEGRILAWVTSLFIQFIFTTFLFAPQKKYLKFEIKIPYLKELIIFGYPLIFHQLGKFVINQSDRLFITKMVSIDAAGIYSVGYQVGSMLLLPIGAFVNFYAPFVYERLANINEEKKIEIVRLSYYFVAIILICFVGIIAISPLFFKLLIDPKFNGGMQYVFWVALAYVFWGGYMLFATTIFFKQRTKILGWLSVVNVLLNMTLNYFFINKFGPVGAAYATSVSFFVVLLITAFFSNKFYPMPWLFFLKDRNVLSNQ
ncbi:MAG: oligosaccharide flippase family protein [Bacteroidota bacterium]